jgi:hypothetical protein
MRKKITILTMGVLCLGINSCAGVGRKAASIAGSKLVQSTENKAASMAGSKLVQSAESKAASMAGSRLGQSAESKAASMAESHSGLISAHEIERAKKKIYDDAYEAALDYFEKQGRRSTIQRATEIASEAADNENRVLGKMFDSATVEIVSSLAVTTAYATYRAKT